MGNTRIHQFAPRRPAFQTVHDRRALHCLATRVMVDQKPLDDVALGKRALRTEFRGGLLLGFLWGVGLVGFFWLLNLWVDVGGAP